jgi:2-amino-4-hydroxy-6-hydroxymethyldihydropteridine diphosphokinase/dihydropteroate synthase
VARLGVPYVLMHMRGTPQTMQQVQHTSYACVWSDVGRALQQQAERAMAEGIPSWNIVLDPGVGFAKTAEGNLELLRDLGRLRAQELHGPLARAPVLVGASRKGFLGRVTGRAAPRERDLASAVASAAAVAGGAAIVRVHNVPLAREVLQVADAIYRGWLPEEGDAAAQLVAAAL